MAWESVVGLIFSYSALSKYYIIKCNTLTKNHCGALDGCMLAKYDVGKSFFKRPCLVVSWELRSSCIVTIDVVGARRNLNMLVISNLPQK
jgi:hypothetical protein